MAGINAGTVMDSRLMNGIKNIGTGTIISGGMNLAFGVKGYQSAREEGHSVLPATAKAVSESIIVDLLGLPTYLGLQAAEAIPKGLVKGAEALNKQARGMSSMGRNKPFANAAFTDTQQAYTMRQAGMQMAQASKHNLQHAMLGNEAQYLHL
jgi:hypothetical protein